MPQFKSNTRSYSSKGSSTQSQGIFQWKDEKPLKTRVQRSGSKTQTGHLGQIGFKDSDRPSGLSQPTGQTGFQKRPHSLDTPDCSPRLSPVPRFPKTPRWALGKQTQLASSCRKLPEAEDQHPPPTPAPNTEGWDGRLPLAIGQGGLRSGV